MTCSYVILAHKDAPQLHRLLRALSPAVAFLHIDSGVSRATHQALLDACLPTTRLLPRRRTGWASWNLVEAMVIGIREALAEETSHIVLLSGQDYPLRSSAAIDAFVDSQESTSFVFASPLRLRQLGKGSSLDRVRFWHTPWQGRRLRFPVARRYPSGYEPWFSQQWAIFSRRAAACLLSSFEHDHSLRKFYRHVWIPDEGYFATVLMNSKEREYVNTQNRWFVRWSPPSAHPDVLTEADFEALATASSGASDVGGWADLKLFARKLETGRSDALLRRIDAELLR